MDKFLELPERDTILFVNEIPINQLEWVVDGVKEVSKVLGRDLKILLISEEKDKKVPKYTAKMFPFEFTHIKTDTRSYLKLEKVLMPYQAQILTAVCRGDRNINIFQRIIPQLPFVRTPTTQSLQWSTNKIDMRRRLRAFSKKISPDYAIIEDASRESIRKITSNLSFPVVVKPAGLGASAFVSICYYEEEMEKVLRKIFRKLRSVHRVRGYSQKNAGVLVEEFMEGNMFVTDIYVNSRGTMYTTPLVSVATGHSSGMEDFFGYKQTTPSGLKSESREKAFTVAKQAVEALGLSSVTAHVELIKSPDGWKVVEVGPRVGGFRDFLYSKSFGINHSANDILIRLPLKPVIPRTTLAHSAVMKIFPKLEGTYVKTTGLKKARGFASVCDITVKLREGDKAIFARNGGGGVADVYLSHKDKATLLADMRRIEQTVQVHIMPNRKSIIEQILPGVVGEIPGIDRLLKNK